MYNTIGWHIQETFFIVIKLLFRAFDVQALVGNISGYIGLCLGYSLLQIPELVIMIFCKAKGYFLMKLLKRHDNN